MQPRNIGHIIPVTVIRRTAFSVIAMPGAERTKVLSGLFQIDVSRKTTVDTLAVTAVISRAVEEHPDPQGDVFHFDFFFPLFQRLFFLEGHCFRGGAEGVFR